MRNLLAMFLLIVNIVSSPLTCKASDSQSPQRSNTLSNETWAFMNTSIGALLRLRHQGNEAGGVRRSEANPVAITVPDASDPNFYQAWGQAARMPGATLEQQRDKENLLEAFRSALKVKDERERKEREERLLKEKQKFDALRKRLPRNSDGKIQAPGQDFSGEVFDLSLGSFGGADFSGSSFLGTTFLPGCVLSYANFANADLRGTQFPLGCIYI